MAWTLRLSINPQNRNAQTFNSPNINVPAVVDELKFDFLFPNQLTDIASGQLRVQFSVDAGSSWLPQNVFVWEIEDKIGTIDKNGNTITENPTPSFIIPVPEAAKSALMRCQITLNQRQFIGLNIYSQ